MISGLLFLLQIQAVTPLKLALIYPDANPAMNTQTAEMKCISEAVVKDFQRRGLKIEFKTYDNRREAARTREVAEEIVKTGYDLVIGTTGSAEAMVAAELFNAKRIPFITPNASLATIVENRPFAFLFTANDRLQSTQLARYINRKFKPKRVVIIQNLSMPYSTFHTAEMQKHLYAIKKGPEVLIENFVDGEFNPAEMMPRIEKFSPDLIFTPIAGPHLSAFYNEIKKSKLTKRVAILGSDHIGGRTQFLKSLGGTDPRFPIQYISMWDGELHSAGKMDFDRLYKKECGDQTVTMPMVSAFDTTRMVLQKLLQNPKLRGENLAAALRNQTYLGVMGKISYREQNSPLRQYQLFEVRGESKFWVKALE